MRHPASPHAPPAADADPFDLQRFVQAQAAVIDDVQAELSAGRKTSHWMWFVFPQLRALGRSATAHRYGIASLDEACAYAHHPVLGPRLIDCTQRVLDVQGRSLHTIFGSPDDLKFRSCSTLFEVAVPEVPVFTRALDALCAGQRDAATLAWLSAEGRTRPLT